jgi:dTDP-4-dehydrorhamnose reductase
MRILITGVNGLLGQKLVELLLRESDVELIGTGRGSNRTNLESSQYYSLDVEDGDSVQKIFNSIKPDSVIHTAAMTQVDDCELQQEACYKANVVAVQNVVNGCEAVGAHLIHLSTDFIFDGSHGPLSEDESPNPVNYYGESKLRAEEIIIKSNLSWAMARTVLVYGVVKGLQRSNIILWVKQSLEQGKPLKIVDDQWRTPTLAEDLAMGCWLIAKNKAEGIFNISGEDFLTPYDMAMKVVDFFSLDASLITRADSSTFTQPAKRPPKTGFIIEKAKRQLGYQPHSFEEGIRIIAAQTEQAF